MKTLNNRTRVNIDGWGNERMKNIIALMLVSFGLFACVPTFAQAEDKGIQEEVFYRILVDRYSNANAQIDKQIDLDNPMTYHGGDLEGITERLDTFEEVGYTAIVLSPIMENAPDGYHGYWIEDFYNVEEQYGDMESLKKLIDEAHQRDIKVVLELVTNYVAKSHPIVKDKSKQSWIEANDVDTAWGKNVIKLNQENEEVQDYLVDVAMYWMDETNIDGFQLHAADQSSQTFLNLLTSKIKEKDENFYLLADVLDTNSDVTSLQENDHIDAVDNHQAQQAMSSVFSKPGVSPEKIYEETMDVNALSMLFMDDESVERFTQTLAEKGRNPLTAWSLALTYLYSMPDVPVVYQGTELPMYGKMLEEVQRMVEFNSGGKEIKEFFNRISSLRNQFPALRRGSYELVGTDGAMILFKRIYNEETMYIAINNDVKTRSVTITDLEKGKELRGYLGDHTFRANDKGEYRIGLDRETAEVFSVKEDTGFNWWFIGFIVGVFLLFIIAVVVLSRKQKANNR